MQIIPPRQQDPNALLRAAEAAFGAGRAGEARDLLETVLRIVPGHPRLLQFMAVILRALGDLAGAHRAAAKAHKAAPRDPVIAATLGNMAADFGRHDEALAAYDRALAIDPAQAEARLQRGVALQELRRPDEARAAFAAHAALAPADPEPLVAHAGLELEEGDPDVAAALLDRALALDPAHARALRGRTRVALERAEPDAPARLSAARAALPHDRDLLLDALDSSGDPATVTEVEAALAADPAWHAGRRRLALFRREEQGRDDWLAPHESAAVARPRDVEVWRGLIGLHAAIDDFHAAATAARRAAAATGATDFLASAFGFHAAAGELDEAAALLAMPTVAARIDRLARAKYLLRRRDPAAAEAALAPLCRDWAGPETWALRGVAWQALGDPRFEWLNGQPGLVAPLDLGLSEPARHGVVALLRHLHRDAALRLGQSVRGGTQTRGNLFVRLEPELRRLRDAIFAALEAYRAGLPPADPAHPLLRHRDAAFRMTASWSVRLTRGGFHISHIHPKGVISSASYWVVPSPGEDDQDAGWLELGRPPAYLGMDLPPVATIRPLPGRLVLFPSTLHHGTRMFTGGERITAAFDLAPR